MSKEVLRDPFGARIKIYESEFDTIVKSRLFMLRLDGHGFSKFTRPFKKPFDSILTESMISTAMDLMAEFHAVFAYTQSDEITLGFVKSESGQSYADSRVQKMVSLSAGKASAIFNKYLRDFLELFDDDTAYKEKISEHISTKHAFFDSRIFSVPSEIEMFNSFLWRQRDAEKNSKAMLSQKYFSEKQLRGLKADEMIQKVYTEKCVDWNALPECFKFGTLIKKELYTREDGIVRKRFVRLTDKMNFSDKNVTKLLNKVI